MTLKISADRLTNRNGSERPIEEVRINGASVTLVFRAGITKAHTGACRLRRDTGGKAFGMHFGGPKG